MGEGLKEVGARVAEKRPHGTPRRQKTNLQERLGIEVAPKHIGLRQRAVDPIA
jgi:hypothetical protein